MLERLIKTKTFSIDTETLELKVSYLDLVAYAYLKEELVNTQDSAEVKYV